jgi:protocatechuate 3,4-dioxygenase beta subunit
MTGDDGSYLVRTIKPGAYIARKDIDWWRPPHVHFSVVGSGVRLVTQMYFPDEPYNEQDFIFLTVPNDERDRVIGRPAAKRAGGRAFQFDIVIRGRFQTPPDMD